MIHSSASAIEFQQVHLSLGAGAVRVHILRGIDLSIARGASFGLIGPSGSGKTTLLMAMAGLEKIDSGQIVVAGQNFKGMDEDDLARFRGRKIGIVFQSFHLIANMTALENVAVPLELVGDLKAYEKAREELAAVGLGNRLDHYPAQLSGGERQRTAIARALVIAPDILIADEPTGNLDRKTGEQIIDTIFTASRQRGTTLVLVTHDQSIARRCEVVKSMNSGQIGDDNPGLAAEGLQG